MVEKDYKRFDMKKDGFPPIHESLASSMLSAYFEANSAQQGILDENQVYLV